MMNSFEQHVSISENWDCYNTLLDCRERNIFLSNALKMAETLGLNTNRLNGIKGAAILLNCELQHLILPSCVEYYNKIQLDLRHNIPNKIAVCSSRPRTPGVKNCSKATHWYKNTYCSSGF